MSRIPTLGQAVLYYDRLDEPLPVTLNDGTQATVQRIERRVLGVVNVEDISFSITPPKPSEDA